MFRKVLSSYAAQARFLHANLKNDWEVRGWTKLATNGAVKPVFTLVGSEVPVVVLNGRIHREVVVVEILDADVRATEEECYS